MISMKSAGALYTFLPRVFVGRLNRKLWPATITTLTTSGSSSMNSAARARWAAARTSAKEALG